MSIKIKIKDNTDIVVKESEKNIASLLVKKVRRPMRSLNKRMKSAISSGQKM